MLKLLIIKCKSFWFCITLGELFAILCVIFLLSNANLHVKAILRPLCYPIDQFIVWYAYTLNKGSVDTVPWLLPFILWWLILGFSVGLGIFFILYRIKKLV